MIRLTDDAIPVRDAARPMAADLHRYPFGYSGIDHPSDGSAPEVMSQRRRDSRNSTGCRPRPFEVFDPLPSVTSLRLVPQDLIADWKHSLDWAIERNLWCSLVHNGVT